MAYSWLAVGRDSCYFVLYHIQDDSIFTGKTWSAAEEESLLDAMDMYSFGNWYICFTETFRFLTAVL